METVLTAAIVAVAALLGSAITYLFQLKNTDQEEKFAHDERIRTERLESYRALATAITDLCDARCDEWDKPQGSPGRDQNTGGEWSLPHLRSRAKDAFVRVWFIAADPDLVASASGALDQVCRTPNIEDADGLTEYRKHTHRAVEAFLMTAQEQLEACPLRVNDRLEKRMHGQVA